MIRSLSTAASGMAAQELEIDVIANNLANVNTTGFKKARAEFQDLFYQEIRAARRSEEGQAQGAPAPLEIGQGTRAIASWIGTLASGGLITDAHQEAGLSVAAYVVGESRLAELREWLVELEPDAVVEAQKAAIGALIWMANADRKLDPEEAHLLKQIILASRMDADHQDEMVSAVHDPPSLESLSLRIGHPVLAELLVGLAWELADADGDISRSEESFMVGLGGKLGVEPARVAEIREAIVAKVAR